MGDLKQRLNSAVERRDAAVLNTERVQGRLDSARKNVQDVEAEIRKRGVDPDELDTTIKAVETKLTGLVTDLEARITQSEQEIAPFLEDDIL